MSEEQGNTETTEAGGGGDDEGRSKDDRRREALSNRLKASDAKVKEQSKTIADLQASVEKLQGDLDGKSGSIDKIVERKDSRIKQLEAELLDRDSTIDGMRRGSRTEKFVQALAAETGAPAARLQGLLVVAKQRDPEFDDAPDIIDTVTLKSALRVLKPIDPSTFEANTTESGKARPRPGPAPREHTSTLDKGEQRPLSEVEQRLANNEWLQPPKNGRLL